MSKNPTDTAMVRRQLYVTTRQDMIIRKLAARSGMTASEHYRRAIDSYINRATAAEEKKDLRPISRAHWMHSKLSASTTACKPSRTRRSWPDWRGTRSR